MNDKLKDNKCVIRFWCYHNVPDKCVYFSGDKDICKYQEPAGQCLSTVANVNRMTIELKKLKGEL